MARVISFMNQKGGTGKTTLCINLAAGLAHMSKKVLVVDMDFQCNATTGLGLSTDNNGKSTFDLIKDSDISAATAIKDTYLNNLKMIPSSFDLKLIDAVLELEPEKSLILQRKLESINNLFDFILIDNPPSITKVIYNSVIASDYIYVPVEMSYFSLEGLTQVEDMVGSMNEITSNNYHLMERAVGTGNINYSPRVIKLGGVILNKWNPVARIDREIQNILSKTYISEIFDTKIMDDVLIREAIGEGVSIIDYAKGSRGAEDILNFTREVMHRESAR